MAATTCTECKVVGATSAKPLCKGCYRALIASAPHRRRNGLKRIAKIKEMLNELG